MTTDRPLLAVLLMLAFCVVAPLIDVAAKLAAASVSVGLITLARFAVQGVAMAPAMAALRLGWAVARGTAGLVALRAACSLAATFCFVAAVAVMPIADALAIVFVAPFLLMLMGWLWLGESVGPRRLAAATVGFAGALLVIQPNFAAFGAVALLPLLTALFFAFYMLVTRHLRGMHPVAMQVHTAWMAVLMAVPLLGLGAVWQVAPLMPSWPAPPVLALLVGVGLAAAVSHLCLTWALRLAPSATLAPLQYLEIPGAVALGWLVFGDFPDPLAWAGIGVITASGLYLIHRERVTARAGAA